MGRLVNAEQPQVEVFAEPGNIEMGVSTHRVYWTSSPFSSAVAISRTSS